MYRRSNVLVGDTVMVTEARNGEKVATATHAESLDLIDIGDTVAILPCQGGGKLCCPLTQADVGDSVAVHSLQGGGRVAVRLDELFTRTVSILGTSYGFSYTVAPDVPADLGTYSFRWDGESQVYLRGSLGGAGVAFIDVIYLSGLNVVSITVTTKVGSLSTLVDRTLGIFQNPAAADLEITPLLKRGDNSINVKITSTAPTTASFLGTGAFITVQGVGEVPQG